MQLYHCRQYSDCEHAANFIASKLEGPGHLHGQKITFDRCWLNDLQLCLFK